MAGRHGKRSPGRHGLDEYCTGIPSDRWLAQAKADARADRATPSALPEDPVGKKSAPRGDLAQPTGEATPNRENLPTAASPAPSRPADARPQVAGSPDTPTGDDPLFPGPLAPAVPAHRAEPEGEDLGPIPGLEDTRQAEPETADADQADEAPAGKQGQQPEESAEPAPSSSGDAKRERPRRRSVRERMEDEPSPDSPSSQSPDTDEFEIDPRTMAPMRATADNELRDYLEIGAYQGALLTAGLFFVFLFSGGQVPYSLGHLLLAPLIVAGTVGLAATYLHGITRKSRRFAVGASIACTAIAIPLITAIVMLGQRLIFFVGSPWWWLAFTALFIVLAMIVRRMPPAAPRPELKPGDDEEWKRRVGEILRTAKRMSDGRVEEIVRRAEEKAEGPLLEQYGSPREFTRDFEVDTESSNKRMASFSLIAALFFLGIAAFQMLSDSSGSYSIALALLLAAISFNSWWRYRSRRDSSSDSSSEDPTE